MMKRLPIPLLISALGLFVLPPVLLALGLTMTSASEVVTFALACMALNILVGYTGLTSFGHGAWFGLAAYGQACRSATGSPARSSCRSPSVSRS